MPVGASEPGLGAAPAHSGAVPGLNLLEQWDCALFREANAREWLCEGFRATPHPLGARRYLAKWMSAVGFLLEQPLWSSFGALKKNIWSEVIEMMSLKTHGVLVLVGVMMASSLFGQEFTSNFNQEGCTFSTTGNNPYYPLLPGHQTLLVGEEVDEDDETVEISHRITVTNDTQVIDGVTTRIVQEFEEEDGELVEISYNFIASCRETGDIWYFGEDVEDYEDGEIVSRNGEWRAGVDGATAGIIMPGTPILGARFYEEFATNAQDRGEVIAMGATMAVPFGSYDDVLETEETNALEPGAAGSKFYARGIGVIKDEALELVAFTPSGCVPDATTHCLNNGRFMVTADYTLADGTEGDGQAILASADSGEFWFFDSGNTEVLVKVLDACNIAGFNSYWVFAAGLTDVELTVEVTDLVSGQLKEYDNDQATPFAPVLDTAAFKTCP